MNLSPDPKKLPDWVPAKLTPRQQGLLKLVLGALGFALVFSYVMSGGLEPDHGGRRNINHLIGLGIPGAIAAAGLLQVVTGRRFAELDAWWMGLRGWQRGVLGIFVVVLALALVVAAMVASYYLGFI